MRIRLLVEVNGKVVAEETVLDLPGAAVVAAMPEAPAPQPGVLAPEIVSVGGKLRLREVTLPVDP